MTFQATQIPGCFEVTLRTLEDGRGSLTKIFRASDFASCGFPFSFKESFISFSQKGVLRGLHFQAPPHDQAKGVFCVGGSIFDVVLDLRKESPMFRKWIAFDLRSTEPKLILIPRGCAHGFYVTDAASEVLYLTETEHNSEADTGLLWNSAGIQWPFQGIPLLSDRDLQFQTLEQFQSPF